MNESTLSASRFASVLPTLESATWDVFSFHVVQMVSHFEATLSDHLLTLLVTGNFRARQVVNGRSIDGRLGPGSVGLVPANQRVTWDAGPTSGDPRAASLFLPDAFLARIISQDWDKEPRSVEFVPQLLARDPIIEAVVTRLAVDARRGFPSGQLYSESACEFLAHHVIHSYSSLSMPPRRSKGGLAPRRLKVVLEYIHDSLAEPITLRRLAELAGVSPRHFERAFRQAVGVPPHAYVMEKRVAAARHLLLSEPALAIGEIATRVGFSSPSHLAHAFRRNTGYSPTAFRHMQSR
jgi:AraC family transcriptional regulator